MACRRFARARQVLLMFLDINRSSRGLGFAGGLGDFKGYAIHACIRTCIYTYVYIEIYSEMWMT